MNESIIIKEAASEIELHKVEELQKEIFGSSETEIVGAGALLLSNIVGVLFY